MLTLQQTNQQRTVIHRVFYQRRPRHRPLIRELGALDANMLAVGGKRLLTDTVRNYREQDLRSFA